MQGAPAGDFSLEGVDLSLEMEKPLRRVAVSRIKNCFQVLNRANQLQAILFADIFLVAFTSVCQVE